MEQSDVKKYQAAREGLVVLKRSSLAMLLISILLTFSHALGVSQYLIYMFPGLAVFVFVNIWVGYKGVSYKDLLNIIERQISEDPKAIQKLLQRDT